MYTSRIAIIIAVAFSACDVPEGRGIGADVAENMEYAAEGALSEDYAFEQRDEDRVLEMPPCQRTEDGPDLRKFRADELTARVEVMDDGWIGLAVGTDDDGEVIVGCMSAETAVISQDVGLSFAEVGPTRDGVRVVIATPVGLTLRKLSWLEQVGDEFYSAETGFVVRTFWVDDDERPMESDYATPTEKQLLHLVDEARKGVGSVAGLAPDLLAIPSEA